ncbi:copper chaperone PCu(A)C [Amycolatopsis thermalba]|uniref:copper chaperone PCu(A)C n=1 Tax=Amycolatopsis thermalba TaxID=944492 RepID=UPI001F07EC19|nr:copper chaperone PCu(A)C [Amycolatopsis thermalba]
MRLQKRRVVGASVVAVGAALALAGCGAGQITQTNTMLPAVNGAMAQAGKLVLRDAGLVNRNDCQQAYASGSSAPLTLVIANDGTADDELVSVSSANAGSATIEGQKAVVAGSKLLVGPATEGESVQQPSSASPTSPTSGSPTSPASASPSAGPTGQAARVGHAEIVLQGIKQVVWPGQTVPVTFTFRDAGPVTVQLPIHAPTVELSCQPSASHEAGGH